MDQKDQIDEIVQRIVAQIKEEKSKDAEPAESFYPLSESSADLLKAKSGKPFREVTYEGLIQGSVTGDDLKTHAETLRMQADIAKKAGKESFAQNLIRAAEMVSIPDDEVLRIYNLLRPNRTDKKTLLENAAMLREQYQAPNLAKLVEEAAEIYEKRGIVQQ